MESTARDILTNPVFWGEVGLAAASKLALLAAVLWVARLTAPELGGRRAETPMAFAGVERSDRRRSAEATAGRPGMSPEPVYLNLRGQPEHRETTQRDLLQERLLAYIDARGTERNRR
jgi:hypothetical protein